MDYKNALRRTAGLRKFQDERPSTLTTELLELRYQLKGELKKEKDPLEKKAIRAVLSLVTMFLLTKANEDAPAHPWRVLGVNRVRYGCTWLWLFWISFGTKLNPGEVAPWKEKVEERWRNTWNPQNLEGDTPPLVITPNSDGSRYLLDIG